jgi:hypothetical protein
MSVKAPGEALRYPLGASHVLVGGVLTNGGELLCSTLAVDSDELQLVSVL